MTVAVSERYNRQVLQWGEENQQKIETASVLIAGVGGLGTTVSQLLARAGVGKIYLVDDGLISWPDLNRQTLYTEQDIGLAKVAVAQCRLEQINSTARIEVLRQRIDSSFRIPNDIALAADCLDNYASRFYLEAALPLESFLVHGGIERNQGQILTLQKGNSQPLAEIFAGTDQPQGSIPVSGPNVAIIAGLMANELLQVIFGQPNLLNRCLIVGLSDLNFSFLEV